MGRFNVLQWNPRQDSSEGVDYEAAGLNPETTVVLSRPTARSCYCGCQTNPVGRDRQFAIGHDARLKGKLIRAHLTGSPVAYLVGQVLEDQGTAMVFAATHGWGRVLLEAEAKQGPGIKAKLEAANRRVTTAAIGPQVGDRRLVKVGRWAYTGQVLAVYEDTGRYEVEYVTKKGEVVRAEVPADKVGTLVTEEV